MQRKSFTDFRGLLLSVGLALVLLLVSVRWSITYRENAFVDIDEASYMRMAIADYAALRSDGLLGWLIQVFRPGLQSPIVPAVTSLVFLVGGPGLHSALLIPLTAGAAVGVVAYLLSRAIGGRRSVALCVSALVGTCPLLLIFSRDYHFSAPATLVPLGALWGLSRSDRFRRLPYVLAFSIALGLLPLTRTMTLGFVPGLLAGTLFYIFADGNFAARKLRHLAIAGAVSLVVAMSWLLLSMRYVVPYLTNFGYGARARDYGPASSPFGLSSWAFTGRLILSQVYLPHAAVLIFLVAGAGAFLFVKLRSGRGRAILMHPGIPSALALFCGLAVLTATSNKGSAFVLPLIPVALVLWGALVTGIPNGRRVIVTWGFMTSLLAFLPHIDEGMTISRPWRVDLPILGDTIVTSGRSYFASHYAAQLNLDPIDTNTVAPGDRDRWRSLYLEIGEFLSTYPGQAQPSLTGTFFSAQTNSH